MNTAPQTAQAQRPEHAAATGSQAHRRPTLRAVLLVILGLPVALFPVLVDSGLWTVWLAFFGVSTLAIGLDGLLVIPRRAVALNIELPPTLYIGAQDPLTLEVAIPSERGGLTLEAHLEIGPLFYPTPTSWITLSPETEHRGEVRMPLHPRRRGTARVEAIWLRWAGPMGLMHQVVRLPIEASIPVVPDIRAVKAAAIRLFQSSEFIAGLKTQRYIGDGSEFEALREYRPGLDHRAMDWKASAKHRKLLCREFRAERNHQIILAFDTGHLMGEPLGGMPKLDHAINAGLLLAYYCLKGGDRVGVFGFDEQVRLFAEPEGGIHAIHGLQQRVASLDYSPNETNFTLGLTHLLTRLRRRSLVVVLTDFVDTVTAELMIDNLQRLARRHLVVFVSLRDPALNVLAESSPDGLTQLNRISVCGDLIQEREEVILRLARLGVFCIDAPPEGITADLLNRYLEIKRREML